VNVFTAEHASQVKATPVTSLPLLLTPVMTSLSPPMATMSPANAVLMSSLLFVLLLCVSGGTH
jgi:hypothetical protein